MNSKRSQNSFENSTRFSSRQLKAQLLNSLDSPKALAVLPWLAGAGMALGHTLTASNCSIPKQGSCSVCGSCVLALGSLTAWALLKQHDSKQQPFYEIDHSQLPGGDNGFAD